MDVDVRQFLEHSLRPAFPFAVPAVGGHQEVRVLDRGLDDRDVGLPDVDRLTPLIEQILRVLRAEGGEIGYVEKSESAFEGFSINQVTAPWVSSPTVAEQGEPVPAVC